MSETIIKVENLFKQYQLGQVGTGTLTRDLQRWYSRIRGKEDPTLKIGQENILSAPHSPLSAPRSSDFVWALKDINFEVKQGEVLGIIGKNGAGKSTLLKILSQVTSPTTGEVKIKGRIASLLEVGTGFHPELTGRENIYLNGAILGMTKNEIKRNFDEIVDFSGVEKYIDTPVKRYSSGMTVRLAFAVAAHLEPEIMVVDGVLAVGDAEFQEKCLGKMQDISQGQGRTVLFVSHNMGAIQNICTTAVILTNGEISIKQPTKTAIDIYLNRGLDLRTEYKSPIVKKEPYIKLGNIFQDEKSNSVFQIDRPIKIYIEIEDYSFKELVTTVLIQNQAGLTIYHSTDEFNRIKILDSKKRICTIPSYGLIDGEYKVTLALGKRNVALYEKLTDILTFQVAFSGKTAEFNTAKTWKGLVGPGALNWE